jgi:hypothetical protein
MSAFPNYMTDANDDAYEGERGEPSEDESHPNGCGGNNDGDDQDDFEWPHDIERDDIEQVEYGSA